MQEAAQAATPPRTGRPALRFEALDGWRGLCACLVVLFHFHGYSPLYRSPLVRNSYLFVDFFFVLSGFVIAWNYAHRLDGWPAVRRFMALRLGRVYPLHFFMLLCFVALETLKLAAGYPQSAATAFTGENQPFAVLTNLLLLQSLGLHHSLTWNGPSWSISTEFWTYLLFALAALWLGLRNSLLVGIALIAPLALSHLSRSGMDTTYDWGLLRCVFGFALGVACERLYLASTTVAPGRAPSAGMTAVELATVAAVVLFVSAAGTSALSFMAPFVFAVAVLVFAREGGWVSRLLRWGPLHTLGLLSYSIYLTHFLLVLLLPAVVKRVLGQDLWTPMPLADGAWVMAFGRNDVQGTLLYALLLVATVAFSALTWRFVETPGREWTRRWLVRTKPRELSQASYKPPR
ncbi:MULTISPECIES: acyltransferase [Ramlibacter]|uniref:Acyltransferase n=1 Tax=Ramlibacter aquaticus TaxID=2780094 RepID=A0ABR9SH85_9BURK|nr:MULTISPECIES: acyltransferase [Ramlibacter]MBE7941715.1 acyltransferase [Ramlibacter aquaticus]